MAMSQWQGLGLAIGATLTDLKRATTLASVTVMAFMLAGGYFVKVMTHSIPTCESNMIMEWNGMGVT